MDKILLVGTSFARNGEGVPDMNYTFREYLSKEIGLDSIDIYQASGQCFPRLNRMLARNFFLLQIKKLIEKKFIHVHNYAVVSEKLPQFSQKFCHM